MLTDADWHRDRTQMCDCKQHGYKLAAVTDQHRHAVASSNAALGQPCRQARRLVGQLLPIQALFATHNGLALRVTRRCVG